MRWILAFISVGLVLAGAAFAQSPTDPCRPVADERPVHETLLTHFQVFEGSVKLAAYERPVPAGSYGPTIAPAVVDFNARNASACAAANGAMTDIPLIEGPHRTRLSRVGFDVDATMAFAEITMIGGPEIGSSHFVVLKRDGPRWIVIEEQLYRIF